MKNRKLRMGMVGGGSDAFIGAIHRSAAFLDNQIELVCGCFSVNPDISISSGRSYYLPEDRVYKTYQQLFDHEASLPEGERMDFVTIVTPNKWHFEPAMIALEKGFHVVVDKPMTFSLEEAKLLQKKVEETGLILALTHVYTGYPAVKEAKERVAKGELGKIRRVYVEYSQGWLSERIELQGGNNAGWRTDPKRSGKAGSVGDIGTHAWHLSEYITGQKVTELCADLKAFAPGRPIDDDAAAFLRYDKGATGVLTCSQIAAGEENKLTIRVYGEKGGLEWRQEEPNSLYLKWTDKPKEIIRMGNNGFIGDLSKYNTRTPGGHPEGFIESFANIYRNFAATVRSVQSGEKPAGKALDFPTVTDGVRGMQFIETMVEAGYNEKQKWQKWID
ncbi:MAG: Gfo/Idh/MocA family oxidoreductase [Tannerellaceae bacterium]|jgi:predicted dehydrogenase|nr:Gfo/Idh/MocA family oxidoreductase [Tannerellaceae bacterium]